MPEVTLDLAKPFFLIEILDKDSNNVKYVWSPNIFSEQERPDDSSQIAPESFIEDIEIKSNFSPPVNLGELKINHRIGMTPQIAIKDILKIYLGYYKLNDGQNPVYSLAFTGNIDFIKASLNHTIIKSSSKIKKLTIDKRELAFSTIMTVSDIIKKLAIEDGGLEEASNGLTTTEISKQKGFALSKNLSIYEHIKKLADYVGFDIYMDVFDKFNARAWTPEGVSSSGGGSDQSPVAYWLSDRDSSESDVQNQLLHPIYFGVNTLNMELDIKKKKYTSILIKTLADSEGEETFTIAPPSAEYNDTDSSSGSSSTSEPLELVLPRFTQEDAEKIAEIISKRNNPNLTGTITVIGAPQIRIGDGIEIHGHIFGKKPFTRIGVASSDYDASFTGTGGSEGEGGSGGSSEEILFKIIGIKHLFNDSLGFITKLTISEAEPDEVGVPEGEESIEEEEEETTTAEEEEEEEEEVEEAEEEQPITIVVKTLGPANEVLPNMDYTLICPDGEEIEGTTDGEGTYTHEEMPRGRYQLKFQRIETPEEEEEEEGEEGGGGEAGGE